MSNVNCLQGIACPKCGNDAIINVEVRILAAVTDDGAETFGDMEWDGSSYAECPDCEHRGTLAEFRAEAADGQATEHQHEASHE